ncbi:MAG: DUF3383 family protein [Solibacillus sp.]
MSRYVDVVITRETKPVSEKGFGLPLLLATSKEQEYSVFTDPTEVAEVFGEASPEYKMANRMFGQTPRIYELACYGINYISGTDDVSALPAALNDLINNGNNEFYYIVCPEHGDEEIKALAEWVSGQQKIYGATTSSIALVEELNGMYDRLFLSVHDDDTTYHVEGLIGMCAPKTIGSFTWTFKQVTGVRAARLTGAEINNILKNNSSCQINEAGVLMNAKGVMTSGEYIDNIQATDWLKARITENVFRLLAMKDKVPYTNEGIALVVDVLETVLKQAFRQGIIATNDAGEPDFIITYPRRSEILKNTIAQRILPDIKFVAVVAGAIEKTKINGVLTL